MYKNNFSARISGLLIISLWQKIQRHSQDPIDNFFKACPLFCGMSMQMQYKIPQQFCFLDNFFTTRIYRPSYDINTGKVAALVPSHFHLKKGSLVIFIYFLWIRSTTLRTRRNVIQVFWKYYHTPVSSILEVSGAKFSCLK